MKYINRLFFILLFLSSVLYADTSLDLKGLREEQDALLCDLPDMGKINVILNQRVCYPPLCETTLKINWQVKGKSHSQQLISDGYSSISKIMCDDDGVIISALGNRFNSDEFRFHVRYRYSEADNVFYEAEKWETDSWWNPYLKKLDDYLDQGAFSKARALVFKNGTSNNGGHYYQDTLFFTKFLNANLREARRSWLAGRAEAAAQFIRALVDEIPFYANSINLEKDEAYFIPMLNPKMLKLTGDKRKLFNVLEATDKNNKVICDLVFYLLEGGESTLALELTKQASRLQANNSIVWFYLGKANQLQGNMEQAKKAYQHYYSMMLKQKKIAAVPSEVLKILGKHAELSLREKIKKQWLEYKKKHAAYALAYKGFIGEMPINMYVKNEKYRDSYLTYYDSIQKRDIYLKKKKMRNGYFVVEDEGKHDNPFMVWMLRYSFGGPTTGWRVLPTGERQWVVLSPLLLDE